MNTSGDHLWWDALSSGFIAALTIAAFQGLSSGGANWLLATVGGVVVATGRGFLLPTLGTLRELQSYSARAPKELRNELEGMRQGDLPSFAQSYRPRFDKFTHRARRVLTLAQEEARRFNHNYIGTEHLLLGLIREGDGVAAKVLANLGIEQDKARSAVEFTIGRGDRAVLGEIGLTPRAKKVIGLAVDEARRLNHHYIGTEHLLLGLVREGEGIAAGVLESLGVNLERVRAEIVRVLSRSTPQGPARRPRPDEPEEDTAEDELDPDLHPRRFTAGALLVFAFAREEAMRFNQYPIGEEFLFLALLREQEGIAYHVLGELGVQPVDLRAYAEAEIERGNRTMLDRLVFDVEAEAVNRSAMREAEELGHEPIGTEHLLLAFLNRRSGLPKRVLTTYGITTTGARDVVDRLRANAESGGAEDDVS